MNMEPKGLTSITLQDTILDKFDLSMDYALILIDSVEESRKIADKVKNIKSVAIVDDISLYLPSLEEQQKRIPIIQEINQSISTSKLKDNLTEAEFDQLLSELKRLEMIRKEGSETGYSRLIMWIIKDNFFPVVIDYYDRKNPELLLKTLIQYDIKNVDGIPTATRMVMYNKLEDSQTSIEMLEVKYNVVLDDSLFTTRNLQRK
ncbi:unnamed protein product [marine sediment metagenome]|uniref:Uncharacterized protein TP-0789 domain-containing protein n=1 Tax=marine sediment metagenome TaxID=412755 RepID=X1M5P2_9ZZZZ